MCGESKSPGIAVNYLDRRPDEPVAAQPSDGQSVYLKLDAETGVARLRPWRHAFFHPLVALPRLNVSR